MLVIEMNQSKDQTKDNKHHCERSSRKETTSRSSTPVSFQHMFTGELTVGTMINNNYASNSGRSSRSQTPNFDNISLPSNK